MRDAEACNSQCVVCAWSVVGRDSGGNRGTECSVHSPSKEIHDLKCVIGVLVMVLYYSVFESVIVFRIIVCSKKVCSRNAQSNTSRGQGLMAFTMLIEKLCK